MSARAIVSSTGPQADDHSLSGEALFTVPDRALLHGHRLVRVGLGSPDRFHVGAAEEDFLVQVVRLVVLVTPPGRRPRGEGPALLLGRTGIARARTGTRLGFGDGRWRRRRCSRSRSWSWSSGRGARRRSFAVARPLLTAVPVRAGHLDCGSVRFERRSRKRARRDLAEAKFQSVASKVRDASESSRPRSASALRSGKRLQLCRQYATGYTLRCILRAAPAVWCAGAVARAGASRRSKVEARAEPKKILAP